MNIYHYKTKKVIRPIYKLYLAIIVIFVGFLLLKPLCIALADFLTLPTSDVQCDAIIIEGGPAFSEYFVTQALNAYYSGQAKKILLVLHSYDLKPTIFGIHNYSAFIAAAFDSLNIPPTDYQFYMLRVQDPYTYNSAVALADTLQDIRSILLFNDNFHMRRSYLTFKKVFKAKGIAVFPYTFEIYLNSKNWWTSANGWRRIISEYTKLAFYWFKGYL